MAENKGKGSKETKKGKKLAPKKEIAKLQTLMMFK